MCVISEFKIDVSELTNLEAATRYISFIESKKRKTCLLVVLNDSDNGSFENAMFKAADTVNKNMMLAPPSGGSGNLCQDGKFFCKKDGK